MSDGGDSVSNRPPIEFSIWGCILCISGVIVWTVTGLMHVIGIGVIMIVIGELSAIWRDKL